LRKNSIEAEAINEWFKHRTERLYRSLCTDEDQILQMAQLLCTVIAVASVVVFHQSAVAGICIVPGLGLLVRKK
jgi:hypothetical protein